MEISLKIELTDEQYKGIMDKSIDSINTEEVIKAIRETVVSTMADYIKDNKHIVTQFINAATYRYNSSSTTMEVKGALEEIAVRSLKDSSEKVKEAFEEILMDILKANDNKVNEIVMNILTKAILEGVTGGLTEWKSLLDVGLCSNNAKLSNIMEKLGM